MSRKNFGHLLERYLADKCSLEEKKLVESWFSILEDEDRLTHLENKSFSFIEQRLWNRLQESMSVGQTTLAEPLHSKRIFRLNNALRIAAIFIFLLVGVGIIYTLTTKNSQSNLITAEDWIKKSNKTNIPIKLVLEDGSSLLLNAGSSVYYPEHFEVSKREIKIEGTGFFQVAKDRARPFFVYSDDIVARVLGTSFWMIYNKETEQSAVEVVSGKVAVYTEQPGKQKMAEGIVLKPNEKVIFNKKEKVLISALVDAPIPIQSDSLSQPIENTDFIYDESLLENVVKDLEREYGISIVLSDEEMNNLIFTGNISSLDYHSKLKTICKSLGALYEIKGNRILIKRK